MVSNIPGDGRVSSFPDVSPRWGVGVEARRGGRQRRMLILIETVEHLPLSSGRPVGETTPPEDIVSNEYANHESGPEYVVRCNFYSPTRMDILNAPQI